MLIIINPRYNDYCYLYLDEGSPKGIQRAPPGGELPETGERGITFWESGEELPYADVFK
jgi:hypothetical protein